MAIVHRATISPTKQELVTSWLDAHPWGGAGEVEMVGSYRFDDPDGEVGIESLVVRRSEAVFQLPLTYRGAPLQDAEAGLVTTMEHSVLGSRWIYLATADPVGVDCWVRALRGEQEQVSMDVYDGDERVATRETGITLARGTASGVAADVPAAEVETADGRLWLPHVVVGTDAPGSAVLIGSWGSGSGAVAAI